MNFLLILLYTISMVRLKILFLFSATSFLAFLFSLSPYTHFTPQLLALLAIITLLFLHHESYIVYLISLIVNILVFTTNGLNSPVFFLIYFLLFVIAFQNPPSVTLAYSLTLILLLSQSLNSLNSLLPLVSLVFISPLAWFIGRQYLDNLKLHSSLTKDETNIFLWHSLKLKTALIKIIDSASLLLSNPRLTVSQKTELDNIKDSAKSLLNSSAKLTREIDHETDET